MAQAVQTLQPLDRREVDRTDGPGGGSGGIGKNVGNNLLVYGGNGHPGYGTSAWGTAPGSGGDIDPVLQGATGVGFYLEDGPGTDATTTFDADGNYNDLSDVCTGPAPDISGFDATAIPTLGQIGLAVLVGLLALAAVLVMMRRRSAPHA